MSAPPGYPNLIRSGQNFGNAGGGRLPNSWRRMAEDALPDVLVQLKAALRRPPKIKVKATCPQCKWKFEHMAPLPTLTVMELSKAGETLLKLSGRDKNLAPEVTGIELVQDMILEFQAEMQAEPERLAAFMTRVAGRWMERREDVVGPVGPVVMLEPDPEREAYDQQLEEAYVRHESASDDDYDPMAEE